MTEQYHTPLVIIWQLCTNEQRAFALWKLCSSIPQEKEHGCGINALCRYKCCHLPKGPLDMHGPLNTVNHIPVRQRTTVKLNECHFFGMLNLNEEPRGALNKSYSAPTNVGINIWTVCLVLHKYMRWRLFLLVISTCTEVTLIACI